MRRALLTLPLAAAAWLAVVAATTTPAATPAPSASATPTATAAPAPAPTPTPTPTPTPPSIGVLALQPSLGPPGTTVTIQGHGYRKGESVTIYWDTPSHSFGPVVANDQGAFQLDIKVPEGEPGQHSICQLAPGPPACSQFRLEAAVASPSPTPVLSPTPGGQPPVSTPAPTLAPLDTAGDSPGAVAALLRPPFVIFPVLVLLALLGGCAFWIWVGSRRSGTAGVPLATVVHRSPRPAAAEPAGMAPEAPPAAAVAPAPVPAAPAARPDLPAPRASAEGSFDPPEPGD